MKGISSANSAGLRRVRLDERVLVGTGHVAWWLLVCAVLLSVIGAATVHSASSELATDYLPRQLVWIGLGLCALAFGAAVDYHLLLRFAPQLYALGLAAVAFVTAFGHSAGGARSWFGIGGLGGQPSEFLKLATVVVLARYLAGIKRERLLLRHVAVALALIAVPMALVGLQPDLGGAVMFLPAVAGMLFVCGVRIRRRLLALVVIVGLVMGAGLWTFGMRDYQRDRILSFVQPDRDPLGAGYQLRQSKIAVGSGQALGKGYMQGTQSQLRFLPARHTDFIFAVLAEERGFLGVLVVLLLYVAYFYSALRAAFRARNRSGILIISGLVSILLSYVLYNTAMMVGLLPITGIPLPFLSYGGSFTLFCFLATGIIAGVDLRRYVNR